MAKAKLTEAQIRAAVKAGIPVGSSHAMLWDIELPGFGLKLRATGSSSWLLTYRPKGQGRKATARTLTLGSWPAVTLDAARTAARMHLGAIAQGKDPAVDIQAERNRERNLLPAALTAYEQDLDRRRIVNVKTQMSTLRRGLASLAGREVHTIKLVDIVKLIDALRTAGQKGDDLRKHTRSFLGWAERAGLVPHNVMAGAVMPRQSRAEMIEEEEHGRALSDEELAKVWVAAGTMKPFGAIVRMGLVTGMRRGELAALKWTDISEDRITIAAAGAKTGRKHQVPLTALAKTIISTQPRQAGSAYVFGSLRKVGAEFSGWSKSGAALVKAAGVEMTTHDCRRTCRTLMSRLGVEEGVAELAIGHRRADLVRLYNKDDAWPGRVAAFDLVSEHIAKVVAGLGDSAVSSAVVPMPKRGRKAS
jgi:integrase